MIKQIKVGVIVGVIVFLVTFTCDWLRDYAKQKKSDRTIHILTDSVFTYKKKLNDTTEVFVTQTRQYSQDIAMARRENKTLRSTIMNDVRSRNIQTASNMIVEVNNSDKVIQAYKDSVGFYKGYSEDLYRTLEMQYDTTTNQFDITKDITKVPISKVGYLDKIDYKQYKGIKRIWKRIWESKKLFVRIWSDNPNVKIISDEETTLEKK